MRSGRSCPRKKYSRSWIWKAQEVEKTDQVSRPEGIVKFDNVTFAYKEGENVLKDISFEARKGETIALVGHTGSGKSSIMNLLLGFYEPSEGRLRLMAEDIRTYVQAGAAQAYGNRAAGSVLICRGH